MTDIGTEERYLIEENTITLKNNYKTSTKFSTCFIIIPNIFFSFSEYYK